jgi:hypothetical protein
MIPIGHQGGPWPYLYYGGQDAHGATYWTCDGYSYVSIEQWLKIDWFQSPLPLWCLPPEDYRSTYPNILDDPKLFDLRNEIDRRIKATGAQGSSIWQFNGVAPGTFEPIRHVVIINCGDKDYRPYLRVWTRWERLMVGPCRLLVRLLNRLHIKTMSPEQFWAMCHPHRR